METPSQIFSVEKLRSGLLAGWAQGKVGKIEGKGGEKKPKRKLASLPKMKTKTKRKGFCGKKKQKNFIVMDPSPGPSPLKVAFGMFPQREVQPKKFF